MQHRVLKPYKARCAKNVIAYKMKTVHEKRFSKSTINMYIGHLLHIWYYVALWYFHSFIHLLTSSYFHLYKQNQKIVGMKIKGLEWRYQKAT